MINIIKHLLVFLKFGKEEVELATESGKKLSSVNIDLTSAEKQNKIFGPCGIYHQLTKTRIELLNSVSALLK